MIADNVNCSGLPVLWLPGVLGVVHLFEITFFLLNQSAKYVEKEYTFP